MYPVAFCAAELYFATIRPSLQKIQYIIYPNNKTCQKSPLSGSMQPFEVPATANYIAQVWIGVEGQVGAGIETELWVGTTPGR